MENDDNDKEDIYRRQQGGEIEMGAEWKTDGEEGFR